jgi:polar amino acid transport system substrate-binding protein
MFRKFLLVLLGTLFFAATATAAGLRVGVSGDYPPLIFVQEGRVVGIEADNARAVGEMLGKSLSLVQMPFAALIPALEAGDIDIIMSGMSVTPERSERVVFTDPYMEIGQMAITHTSKVAQFAQPWSVYREGVRIGVEPDTTGAAYAENELKDADIKYFTDPQAAFAGLRDNQIDLYIHDAPTSWQLATAGDNQDLISLYSPLTSETLAWAVRKGDEALAAELNTALRTMKGNGTLRYILNRWIPVTVEVR